MQKIDNVSLIFGDSITYGLHDEKMCGWVNRVRNKLENETDNNFIINLGIPGQKSEDIKNRFEIELKNRYNKTDNFVLIYAIGIKDAATLSKYPDHIEMFEENIKNIIKITKQYTNNIYFIGLLSPDYKKRKEYTKENVLYIDNTIEKICSNEKIEYIKIIDKLKKEYLVDGLHPNSKGHQIIANIVLEKIYGIKGE